MRTRQGPIPVGGKPVSGYSVGGKWFTKDRLHRLVRPGVGEPGWRSSHRETLTIGPDRENSYDERRPGNPPSATAPACGAGHRAGSSFHRLAVNREIQAQKRTGKFPEIALFRDKLVLCQSMVVGWLGPKRSAAPCGITLTVALLGARHPGSTPGARPEFVACTKHQRVRRSPWRRCT